MILVFNDDDFKLIDEAYRNGFTLLMGIPYCYLRGHDFVGLLGVNEPLYISAHGNNFEIGNKGSEKQAFNIKADALAEMLSKNVLPNGYQGNIYLSCCKSHPVYDSDFRQQLSNRRIDYGGTVYGVAGDVGLVVQPHGWGGYRIAQ